MAIELILEGKLENGVTDEAFFDFLKELADKRELPYREYEDRTIFEVCPEGQIECTKAKDFISITAQTNVAGPGFHAYTASLYDEILMESGIGFQVFDHTGYYEKRDFQLLKQNHFYQWLEELVTYLQEHPDAENVCIAWPLQDYVPEARKHHVITPMGYMNMDDFAYGNVEELAKRFFIWNELEKDASYYLNCALNLLWKSCYFEYSMMNAESSKAAYQIIDYLDAAYRLDTTIVLPFVEYRQLCELTQSEQLIQTAKQMEPISGYRQGTVHYPYYDWLIPGSGCCEYFFDYGLNELVLNAPYKHDDDPWNWVIKVNQGMLPDESIRMDFRSVHQDVVIQGFYAHGDDYYAIHAFAVQGEACIQIQLLYRDETMEDTLMQYLHGITHRQMNHNETVH